MAQTPEQALIVPKSKFDQERWHETARRRRMLDGNWADDLAQHLIATLNIKRASNIGRMSRAINLFKSTGSQIGPVLYDGPPVVDIAGTDDMGVEAFEALHDNAHTWQLAQRHALYVVGLRESLYAIEWSKSEETVKLRLVTPDTVEIETPSNDTDDIEVIREARIRRVKTAKGEEFKAFWNVWDRRDGGSFTITDSEGMDMTAEILGEEEAAKPYPFIFEGEPYLPFVLYHAMPTSKVFDPFTWCELVDGAFEIAVDWNNYQKILRDASWAQKYAIDLVLQGVSHDPQGTKTVGSITTSPDSILMFKTINERGGSIGTLEVPVDLEKYANSLLQYQRTFVSTIGVQPADVEQVSGSAQSGYAIQLKRSAQRRLALSHEPQFRDGDIELMEKMAITFNLFSPEGTQAVPETGYSITYRPPDEAVSEQMERLQYGTAMNQLGLMSKVDQYKAEHASASDGDAIRAILVTAAIELALENPMELIGLGAESVDDLVEAVMKATSERPPPVTPPPPAEPTEPNDEPIEDQE